MQVPRGRQVLCRHAERLVHGNLLIVAASGNPFQQHIADLTADMVCIDCAVGDRGQQLARLREGRPQAEAYETKVETTLDALAAHLEANCDLDAMLAIAERGV